MMSNDETNPVWTVEDANNNRSDNAKKDEKPIIACGKYSFLWLLLTSAIQFTIYLNKLYEDSSAVRKYFEEREINFCAVSAFCLFFPALIYLIYIVSFHIKINPGITSKDVGTEVLNGLLLIPRQIKGRIEMLQFAASRVCYLKPLTKKENMEKNKMEQEVTVLTFFETFYAGLTQILLQLYIIISSLNKKVGYSALTGEIIASSLCLLSVIVSVRRRDDGILTGTLSTCGWTLIVISRSVAISLATTVLSAWMVLLCVIHGLGVSVWTFNMAFKSYPQQIWTQFSDRRKIALFWLIFSVLGLPSLTYWPIMFELKNKNRPAKFLCILFAENLLFVCLWATLSEYKVWEMHDCIFVTVTTVCFVLGVIFIFGYIRCKPELTEDIVYHDMKISGENFKFGMFFEFCDAVFHIEKNKRVEKELKEIRGQKKVDKVIFSV